MTNINFPSPPTNGQIYTYGAATYVYDSTIPGWLAYPTLPGGVPCGTIAQWGTNTAPANWMICDGAAISRSTYASLFNVIGTTYGVGDGSTTFNLPDLRGRVPVGKNGGSFGTLAATGGAESVALTAAQIPGHTHSGTTAAAGNHTHTYSGTTNTTGAHTHSLSGSNGGSTNLGPSVTSNSNGDFGYLLNGGRANSAGDHAHTFSGTTSDVSTTHTHTFTTDNGTGGGGSHTNLQPYLVLNYIIKTSMANTPGDSALATRVGALETFNTVPQAVSVGGTGLATATGYLKGSGTSAMSAVVTIPVADGGTGATTLASGGYLKGAGTSAITSQSGIPATDITSGALAVARGGTGTTTGSGLIPIVPTSVTLSSGTATVSALGNITFTGANTATINGVFSSAYNNYKIIITSEADSTPSDVWLQFKNSGGTLGSGYNYLRGNNASGGWSTSYSTSQGSWNLGRTNGYGGTAIDLTLYDPGKNITGSNGYRKYTSTNTDAVFNEMLSGVNGITGAYTGCLISLSGAVTFGGCRIQIYGLAQ
jgi:microcystin-dependent protein